MLWVSGSLGLEEYTRKDGVTKGKRLKLKLTDWGFVPTAQRREQGTGQAKDVDAKNVPSVIDGERDILPE